MVPFTYIFPICDSLIHSFNEVIIKYISNWNLKLDKESSVVLLACNPGNNRLRQGDHGYETSLGYRTRPWFKKEKKSKISKEKFLKI